MSDSMVTMVQILQVLKKIQQNLVDLKDAMEAESRVDEVQPEVEHESELVVAVPDHVPGAGAKSMVIPTGTFTRSIAVSTNTPSCSHFDALNLRNVEFVEDYVVKRFHCPDCELNDNKPSCLPYVCRNVSMSWYGAVDNARFVKPPWKPPDVGWVHDSRSEVKRSYYMKFQWFSRFGNAIESSGINDMSLEQSCCDISNEINIWVAKYFSAGFSVFSELLDFIFVDNKTNIFMYKDECSQLVVTVSLGEAAKAFSLESEKTNVTALAYKSLCEAVAYAAKASRASSVAIALSSSDGFTTESKLTTASAIASGTVHGVFKDNRLRSESKRRVLKLVDVLGMDSSPEMQKKLKYVEDYYKLPHHYRNLKYDARIIVTAPKHCWPCLQPGSLVPIQLTNLDDVPSFSIVDQITWGVTINFVRSKYASEEADIKPEDSSYKIEVPTRCEGTKTEVYSGFGVEAPAVMLRSVEELAHDVFVMSILEKVARKVGDICDVFVGTSILHFCGFCGFSLAARMFFEEMPERNIVWWTILMVGYLNNEGPREVINAYQLMIRESVTGNQNAYATGNSSCSLMEDRLLGRQVIEQVTRSGLDIYVSVANSHVSMFVSLNAVEDAFFVFDHLMGWNTISGNSFVPAYAQNTLLDENNIAKVSDFGLNNPKGNVSGGREYLAPEQLMNLSKTSKSDMYNLGMVLREIVSWRRHFEEVGSKKFWVGAFEEYENGNAEELKKLGVVLQFRDGATFVAACLRLPHRLFGWVWKQSRKVQAPMAAVTELVTLLVLHMIRRMGYFFIVAKVMHTIDIWVFVNKLVTQNLNIRSTFVLTTHLVSTKTCMQEPNSQAQIVVHDGAESETLQGDEIKSAKHFWAAVTLTIGTTIGLRMLRLPALTIRSGPLPSTETIFLPWMYVISSIVLVAELSFALMGEDCDGIVSFTDLATKALGSKIGVVLAVIYASLSFALVVACTPVHSSKPQLGVCLSKEKDAAIFIPKDEVYSCSICKKGEHASVAYRHRQWKLDDDLYLVTRCEVQSAMRGAILATELEKMNKIAKWATHALLACADMMKWIMFSLPRPPETEDLEDKVDFKDGGMIHGEIGRTSGYLM